MSEIVRPPQPENLLDLSNFNGLHGRLLLKNKRFLNPAIQVKPNATEAIPPFQERKYQPFEEASRRDRKKYWEEHQPTEAHQTPYTLWRTNVATNLNDAQSALHVQALAPLWQRVGIDKTTTNDKFTTGHAEQLYARYFKRTPGQSVYGVKLFVEDVMSAYQKDNKPDLITIRKHITDIKWIADIFGKDASAIVAHLVLAESRLQVQTDEFKQELTKTQKDASGKDILRLNTLSEQEKKILRFIHKDLPIEAKRKEIQELLKHNDALIVIGGTGSGKTTQVPQMIREMIVTVQEMMHPSQRHKLIVSQPRQINASNLAGGVAEESNVELGQEVGFSHGGKSKVTDKTDTEFVTEGTLINRLLSDPLLTEATFVMVDEVHVRGTDTEIELALLKEAQRRRSIERPDLPPLKIIAASATVNRDELRAYFNDAPVVDVEGRTYPLAITYETPEGVSGTDKRILAATNAKRFIEEDKLGTGLIAVASVNDIEQYAKAVEAANPNATIITLHANSRDDEKKKVEEEVEPGKYRIIIATDFIQTGITIPDLTYVINTGEVIKPIYDDVTGFTSLLRLPQSKAEIAQWSGRAGRTSPGLVHNLFTEDDYNERNPYPTPELQRSDLTSLLLIIKRRNIPLTAFLSVLPPERLRAAEETLTMLGALNPDKTLNDIGKRMTEYGRDYRLARMIIAADDANSGVSEACTIAALSNENGLFTRDASAQHKAFFNHPESDFLTYLNIWNSYKTSGKPLQEWAELHGINISIFEKAMKNRERLIKKAINKNAPTATPEALQEYITTGFYDRIMRYDEASKSYTPIKPRGTYHDETLTYRIGKDSVLANRTPEYIIAQSGDDSGGRKIVYLTNCQRARSASLTPTASAGSAA